MKFELMKVIVEYDDRISAEAEAKISEATRWGEQARGLPRIKSEVMCAVAPEVGADTVATAGWLAITNLFSDHMKYKAVVVSVERVNYVYVQEQSK